MKKDIQYSPFNPLNVEKPPSDQNVHLKSSPIDNNRKKGLTKYDQDLIEKCTFTESRCRPLTGKRKIELESLYASVKRPRKTVHIIRGKPSVIARRLKANSLKKLTFHSLNEEYKSDYKDANKDTNDRSSTNTVKDNLHINNFNSGPVKIKLKRKKKKKLECEQVSSDSKDNSENCDSILNMNLNYLYEDFLNGFKIKNTSDNYINLLNESKAKQSKFSQRNYLYEQTSANLKDVYEFDDEEDNAIQPLSRKITNVCGKNKSSLDDKTEGVQVREEKHSSKLKLTLKMKKTFVLDNMLEVGDKIQVMEPQYEVLSIQTE